MTTTKSETAAPAASSSSKPAASKATKPNSTRPKPKAKVDPAARFEQLLRDQWAASLRSMSTDLRRGGDFGDLAKQLARIAESLKEAGKVSA